MISVIVSDYPDFVLDKGRFAVLRAVRANLALIERGLSSWQSWGSSVEELRLEDVAESVRQVSDTANLIVAEIAAKTDQFSEDTANEIRFLSRHLNEMARVNRVSLAAVILTIRNFVAATVKDIIVYTQPNIREFARKLREDMGKSIRSAVILVLRDALFSMLKIAPAEWGWLRGLIDFLQNTFR